VQSHAADQDAGGYRGDEPPAAACQHPAEKRPAAGEDQLPAGGGDEDSHDEHGLTRTPRSGCRLPAEHSAVK